MKPTRAFAALLLLFAAHAVQAENSKPIYQVSWDQTQTIGSEWQTEGEIIKSPNARRRFLGRISDSRETILTLKNLPPHEVLTVEVELILVGTWDGAHREWGNDAIQISLGDGRVLMNSSFSNCMGSNWATPQHYPQNLDEGRTFLCFTGSAEIGGLGYRHTWSRDVPNQTVPMDSIYLLRFSIPHHAEAAEIILKSTCSGDAGEEGRFGEQWFGIGNVSVSANNPSPIDERKWTEVRDRLIHGFPHVSNHAFWEMMRHPDRFRSDLALLQEATPGKWWIQRADTLLQVPSETETN